MTSILIAGFFVFLSIFFREQSKRAIFYFLEFITGRDSLGCYDFFVSILSVAVPTSSPAN